MDAYNPEVLFGEVLIHPKWTQPSLSQEDIRRNGGVPPPPEPVMPTDFTIQLYNPEQQIHVSQKSTAILSTTRWEFSMPQEVFRMPSASDLDRSQNDPVAAATTPRINFAWRKESKFTREMTCYMTGRSTDITQKKKSKEPDIAIAHYKGLKDITIYEPNLYRMELEDQKGFEVVLLLCAATIRDVFFARDLATVFNISGTREVRNDSASSVPSATTSPVNPVTGKPPTINGAGAAAGGLYTAQSSKPQRPHANSIPSHKQQYGALPPAPTNSNQPGPKPPQTDPRTQWEIEAETARLRQNAEAEARAAQKAEDRARRERERAAEEETRRLRKMVEKEERHRARREQEERRRVEEETEQLRKMYGVPVAAHPPTTASAPMMNGANQATRPAAASAPIQQAPFQPPRPSQAPQFSYGYQVPGRPQPQSRPQPQPSYTPNTAYQQHFNAQSSSNLNPNQQASSGNRLRRRSFLNIVGDSRDAERMRKKSSVF